MLFGFKRDHVTEARKQKTFVNGKEMHTLRPSHQHTYRSGSMPRNVGNRVCTEFLSAACGLHGLDGLSLSLNIQFYDYDLRPGTKQEFSPLRRNSRVES